MLDLTWKAFWMTGNIGPYLLMKELKEDDQRQEKAERSEAEKVQEQTN